MTRRPRRRVHCLPMDSFEVTQLPTAPLIVCVCSTTGQGDPPANMRQFWRFLLRKSLPPDSLADVKFAVFGLGDSHYQKYNVAAKKLHRRMRALGAVELVGLGLGDDQHPTGYEATLDPWLDTLWRSLGHGTDAEGGHGDKTDLVEDLVTRSLPSRRGRSRAAARGYDAARIARQRRGQGTRAVRRRSRAGPRAGGCGGDTTATPPRYPRNDDRRIVEWTRVRRVSPGGGDRDRQHPAHRRGRRRGGSAPRGGHRRPTTGTRELRVDDRDPESSHERSPLYTPGDCLAVLPLPLAECDVTRARDATGTVLERAGLAPDAWVTLRAAGWASRKSI